MSDIYQATYDAVRSKISGGDISGAIESALRNENIGHHAQMSAAAIQEAAACHATPSAVYRPALSIDGNQWCALYGVNLQDGVTGFGASPALAMADFDKNWRAALPARRK